MNFAFTTPNIALALALGVLLLPMLNVYNFKSRGLGIVRYFIGETTSGLVKMLTFKGALRLAFGLACILALVLVAHGDAQAAPHAPLLLGIVGGVPADLAKSLAAYLGRNQGPELFTNVPHTGGTAQSVVVNRNLSINRPLESIQMVWRGRVTITVANMGAAAAESPQTIINKITINGTYKGTALTPVKISGATANAWSRLFGARGNSIVINGVRQSDALGAQTLANFGNIGVYDIEVYYYIPTWPLVSFSSRAWESVPYFWQPEDWADSLQVQIDFGDQTSFGTVGGATVALSSFGSAAGSPTLSIATQYVILGDFRPNTSFQTAAVIRNENIVTAGMSTIAAGTLLSPMQKQKTTNIMFKSGVSLAGTNAAVQVFASLSDVQIDKTLLTVDNKNIRFNQDNRMNKETVGMKFGTVLPVGYNLFTFLDSQTPRTAFRADDPGVVSQGSTFQLTTDVLTATANQQVNLIQEMIFANKTDPTWLGTR